MDPRSCRFRQARFKRPPLKNGGYSLYPDIYWNGKRSYDFLKLYLNPPTDDLAMMENKTMLELANQIKYKRIPKVQTRENYHLNFLEQSVRRELMQNRAG